MATSYLDSTDNASPAIPTANATDTLDPTKLKPKTLNAVADATVPPAATTPTPDIAAAGAPATATNVAPPSDIPPVSVGSGMTTLPPVAPINATGPYVGAGGVPAGPAGPTQDPTMDATGPYTGSGGVPAGPSGPTQDPTMGAPKTPNNPADPSSWVNGVDPSTPHFASQQLIGNLAGGNMTATGTSANAFDGYKDPTGGGSFGGYGSEYGADAPLVASMANGDSTAMAKGLDSSNPKVAELAAQQISQQLSQGGADRAGLLAKLTPAQREKVGAYYQDTTKNIYNADQAYYDKNRAQNGALYQSDWSDLMRQLANKPGASSAITTAGTEAQGAASAARAGYVDPKAGNWTADPAAFAAAQANGTVPTTVGAAGGGTVPTTSGPKTGSGGGEAIVPGGKQITESAPASGIGSTAATQTPIDPNNALTTQTLGVGPVADRVKTSQNLFDTFQKSTDPAYQASLRDAMRMSAAGGGLGSGMLRTSLGNLENNRALQLDTEQRNQRDNALLGSIDDAYKNVGIAQQQQGFQAGRQDTAFNQGTALQQLQEALKQGQFGRNLATYQAGNQNNPTDVLTMLSQIFGNQATGAGQALNGMVKGNTSQPSTSPDWTALLKQYPQLAGMLQGKGSTPSYGQGTQVDGTGAFDGSVG